MQEKKLRTTIPKLNKMRAELQQENNSSCPFCENQDVGHFEIHHIDTNPSNHEKSNLMLLCRMCHSKITKGEIDAETVYAKKKYQQDRLSIQLISVDIDNENCGWAAISGAPFAFKAVQLKSLFPIFNFTFTNHSPRTVILTNVQIETKRLQVGLSGPATSLPTILRPLIKYKIKMPGHGENTNTSLEDPIEVPAGRAFKFQVELFADSMESFKPPCRYVLLFSFGFNNDFYIEIPKILLNTVEDNDGLRHRGYA
jgi:hypothetical protein